MNLHRLGSIQRELESLGGDIRTELSNGSVLFKSTTTDLSNKRYEIQELANYYGKKVKSLEINKGEITDR